MGTWGYDILQDDQAQDYLGEVLSFVVTSTDKNFRALRRSRTRGAPREALQAMAGVFAARVLIASWPPGCASIAEHVREWQADVNRFYDKADRSDKYAKTWKKSADKEFTRLLDLLRELDAPGMAEGGLPEVGATFAIKLDDGRYGACRVLRAFEAGSDKTKWYKGPYLLVGYTAWVGKKPPTIKEPSLREILVYRGQRKVLFVDEPPDDECQLLGIIPPSPAEKRIQCNAFGGGWNTWVPFIGKMIDDNRAKSLTTRKSARKNNKPPRGSTSQKKEVSKTGSSNRRIRSKRRPL